MDTRAFAGNFLRAEDIDDEIVVTITSATVRSFEDGGKVVIGFSEEVNPMPLNKTNLSAIGDMFGFETEDWLGQQIRITRTQCQFGKKMVDCLRILPVEKVGKKGKKNDTPF